MKYKKAIAIVSAAAAALVITGCESAADRANRNLSAAAENFEVPRRIVGINAITDTVLFSVEGYCSYEISSDAYEAVCLVDRASGEIERTTLGRADNVTLVSTQLSGVKVDMFRPRVIFRPETIVPNFDLSTSGNF